MARRVVLVMRELLDWFHAQRREIWDSFPKEGHGVLMGVPVWGKDFVNRFGLYCLATMVSPANLAALKDRCRLVVFTAAEDRDRLIEMVAPLEASGIQSIVRVIPADVMKWREESDFNKYLVLGVVQSLSILMAGRMGYGYHMLQPDHLFEKDYWPNLMALGEKHDGVIQISVSVGESAIPDLEKYRLPDGELAIPSRDLGDIGWRHLHKQMQMYRMNEAVIPDKLPHSHFMLWQNHDKLVIHSCHHNPAWLSSWVCKRARFDDLRSIVATLDTKLPQLLYGTSVYVPEASDGLTFIELSDDNKQAAPKYVNAMDFAIACHRNVMFTDAYKTLFEQRHEVPIHPQAEGMDDEEIDAQHAQIVALLDEMKPQAAVTLLQAMYAGKVSFPVQTMVKAQ